MRVMSPKRPRSSIDVVTTSPHPPSSPRDDAELRHLRRRAITVGVSIVVLALAWWLSPVLGGVATLVASVVLAAALAPDRIDTQRHGAGCDVRDDGRWLL
jgi:hypothetical protein